MLKKLYAKNWCNCGWEPDGFVYLGAHVCAVRSVHVRGTNSASTNLDDPFHGRYATYGVETTNSIRVLVAGKYISKPGYYFFPKGSTFGDAVKAAGMKKRYDVINIGRKGQTKGRYRMLHFGALEEAQQEVLRDGDEIEIGTRGE